MAEVHFDKNIKIGIPQSAINWCKTHCQICEALLLNRKEKKTRLCKRCYKDADL